MGIAYRIDRELGATFVLWDGIVTADEFLGHVRRLLSEPHWPPHRRLDLTDLRAGEADPSLDEGIIKVAADLYGTHPRIATVRAAIVAYDAFERAVVFERAILRYASSVIVFNTLDTACVWLGLDTVETGRTLEQLRAQLRDRK